MTQNYANPQYLYDGNFNPAQISVDAGGRIRVGQLNTLADFKTLNADQTLLWENAGTGSGTFANNIYEMSVASGQWRVRQSKFALPYGSGKSQQIEWTFDNFGSDANTQKMVGYYSTSTSSPYSGTHDGFFLENSSSNIYLKAYNSGTVTLNKPITEWTNYAQLAEYQSISTWDNFTVTLFDFLWLGGAILRLWVRTSAGFVLAHQFNYPGTQQGTMIKSPNQFARAEIRSTTGAGNFRPICAQISSEGASGENQQVRAVDTGSSAINVNSIGTKYLLMSLRKGASYRDTPIRIKTGQIHVGSSSDQLRWTLEKSPVLSSTPTYTALANSALESANGNGTITATSGTVIASGYATQGQPFDASSLVDNVLSWIPSSLDGTQDRLDLCVTPITSNINAYASITTEQY